MQVAVYFTSVERLLAIEDVLRVVDCRDIPSHLARALFLEEIGTREYRADAVALAWFDSFTAEGDEVSRLYFGQEFCEYLVPRVSELEKALYFSRQLGWDFTYVTGCLTNAGLARVKQNLEFLSREAEGAEVVVNDWGVLSVVAEGFPGLRPVLGRLLVKQKRLARYASQGAALPVNMDEISSSEEDIRDNQLRVYRGLSLANARYREELARLRVERVDLDIVPQGVDLPADTWGLGVGCYFPWAYVAGGRNCMTAATADPQREFAVLDTPCPRPCRALNRWAMVPRPDLVLHQRGNSVFAFTSTYAQPYLQGDIPVDRIVFEPYIPIA